jgi:hypothetical protein
MSRYTKANHRIFMQFVRRDVWHVTFLEPGLDISDATENSPIKTQSQVDKCKETAKTGFDELACGAAGDETDWRTR